MVYGCPVNEVGSVERSVTLRYQSEFRYRTTRLLPFPQTIRTVNVRFPVRSPADHPPAT